MTNVLIIEDDSDIAQMEALALRRDFHVKVIENDFQRALLPESWEDIDVAVVDFMLPLISGGDILRYLKAEFPHIRRVLATAAINASDEVQQDADIVLFKPYSLTKLRAACKVEKDA